MYSLIKQQICRKSRFQSIGRLLLLLVLFLFFFPDKKVKVKSFLKEEKYVFGKCFVFKVKKVQKILTNWYLS